jgi:hypothetical protein
VAEVQRRLPKKVKRRRPAAGDTEVRPVAETAVRHALFWDVGNSSPMRLLTLLCCLLTPLAGWYGGVLGLHLP